MRRVCRLTRTSGSEILRSLRSNPGSDGAKGTHMENERKREKLRGIVRHVAADSRPTGGDVEFSPDYVVTGTTDKGGHVLTNVEVILCFWGSFWSTTPPPSPSRDRKSVEKGKIVILMVCGSKST